MTTKKEILTRIKELQAKLDEMPDDIKTVRAYEPLKMNQSYYEASTFTDLMKYDWCEDPADNNLLEAGQVFLTKEAAAREIKRRKLWHQCRKAMKEAWEAHEELPDWTNNEQDKYIVIIFCDSVEIEDRRIAYSPIYFPTRKLLDKWRKTVTDNEIKLMLIDEW